jgi:hypothetical protein
MRIGGWVVSDEGTYGLSHSDLVRVHKVHILLRLLKIHWRWSAFFAEAAVFVLVLALLDRFMLKGRMEMGWVVSAFTISFALLTASIATDSRRDAGSERMSSRYKVLSQRPTRLHRRYRY